MLEEERRKVFLIEPSERLVVLGSANYRDAMA